MKYIFFCTMIFIAAMSFSSCTTKTANAKTEQIKVWGNCSMCEKTIEGALTLDGIVSAEWDKSTDILTVLYDSLKMNNPSIQMAIANAGYDTENVYANDSVYSQLPKCCLYERKPKE